MWKWSCDTWLKYEWLRFLDQIAEVLSSAFSHSWHTCNLKLQELGRRQYRACCGTSDVISPPSSPDPSLFPCWNLDRTPSTPTTGVARMTRWGRESQSTLTTVCACGSLIVHTYTCSIWWGLPQQIRQHTQLLVSQQLAIVCLSLCLFACHLSLKSSSPRLRRKKQMLYQI